jgi:hypothetical protein
MCSGLADQVSGSESKAMGIHCVISKPIDANALLEKIRDIMSR